MEEHRLKVMQDGYDLELFKKIYQDTAALRKKLAYEINHHRFGIESRDLVSWFDVKFIFVFNKYFGSMPAERLKGHIINALRTYKNRILRVSYQEKFLNNPVEFTDVWEFNHREHDFIDEIENEALNHIKVFMKKNLSEDAYQVFLAQLNPPPFIIERMIEEEKGDFTKIPPLFLAEYLGFGDSKKSIQYINSLRQEIKEVTERAKEYFN